MHGTLKQHDPQQVFDFILSYKRAHDGNSPSIREIAEACGITSTCVVKNILRRLAEAGKIHLARNGKSRARNIEVPGARWIAPAKDRSAL